MTALAAGAAGAGVVSSLLGTGGATGLIAAGTGALATALGGVCQGLVANLLHPSLTRRDDSPESLIQNHDIRRLVGESVAGIIELAAEDVARVCKEDVASVEIAAHAATDYWMSETITATGDYDDLNELAVTEWFSVADLEFKDIQALDVTTWGVFLDGLLRFVQRDCSSPAREIIVTALHRDLPKMLRAKVKQDFEGGTSAEGRGYASLHIYLLGQVIETLQSLSNERQLDQQTQDAAVRVARAVPRSVAVHSKRLSGKERVQLSRVLERIDRLQPAIEKQFRQLRESVGRAASESEQRDRHTHKRLRLIVAGVACTFVATTVALALYMSRGSDLNSQISTIAQEVSAASGRPLNHEHLAHTVEHEWDQWVSKSSNTVALLRSQILGQYPRWTSDYGRVTADAIKQELGRRAGLLEQGVFELSIDRADASEYYRGTNSSEWDAEYLWIIVGEQSTRRCEIRYRAPNEVRLINNPVTFNWSPGERYRFYFTTLWEVHNYEQYLDWAERSAEREGEKGELLKEIEEAKRTADQARMLQARIKLSKLDIPSGRRQKSRNK